MKKLVCLLLVSVCLQVETRAQGIPNPDRLLPGDTLGVFTVPDMTVARRLSGSSPMLRLWRDPALEPFATRFRSQFDAKVLQPLEKNLGTSVADLLDLARGQVTFALTRNGWPAVVDGEPGVLLLVDVRTEGARLRELLARARAKLAEGGEPVKTTMIDTVEFLVIEVERPSVPKPNLDFIPGTDGEGEDAAAVEPDTEEKKAPAELYVGQSGSLFVIGNSKLDIEKSLRLKNGDAVLSLAESSSFSPDFNSTFRNATVYGWLNLEPILDMVRQGFRENGTALPMGLNPSRLLTAVGIAGLRTVSFAGTLGPDGTTTELKLRVPDAARRGIFRIITFNTDDASPPAFVPANALAFSRTRIDLMRAFNSLEATIVDIVPQMGGMVRMMIDAVGKDKDPLFDFRKRFVANLGGDVISWQMAPTGAQQPGSTPPQMVLISSAKPDELAASLKLLMGMVPADVAKLEESEIAGKKVWSMAMPMGLPTGDVPPPTQSIAFAAVNGHLAVTTEPTLLKDYLEGRRPGGSLANKAGLRAAAEKIGGYGTGMFAYGDTRESTRPLWSALTDPNAVGGSPGALMIQQFLAASAMAGDGEGEGLKEWIDLSLLPPFEKVEKYFSYSVFTGAVNKDAFTFKTFAPKPPGL